MRFLWVLIAVAALATKGHADDYDRLRSLPLEEALAQAAAEEGESYGPELFRYLARRFLADLYYPIDLRAPFQPLTDADTVAAIRAFEENAGLLQDGVLTFGEYEHLSQLAAFSQITRLSVGLGRDVAVYGPPLAEVRATGSWSMPDIAWPLNYSTITCRIDEGVCEDSAVTVGAPSITRPSASIHYSVHHAVDRYQIQGWEGGILDAVSSGTCRRVRLTINTLTDLVTQIVEDTDPEGCPMMWSDERLPPIEGVRVATLIRPLDAQQAYFERIQAHVRAAYGPLMDELTEQLDLAPEHGSQ